MDPLEKCIQPLRVLIDAGDDGGIVLAQKAVNEYLASFPIAQRAQRAGALHLLQDAIAPLWQASSGGQTEFINMVLEYTDSRMRALE
jgi:hypothetical protein